MSKYDEKTIKSAKEMYFQYLPYKDILKSTGMTLGALQHYASKYWRREREQFKGELLELMSERKAHFFSEISRYGLEIVLRGLKERVEAGATPTPKEMQAIMSVLNDIDRITRLDRGDPTEIVEEHKPATIVELREALSKDPFGAIEDAELIEEKPNEESN